MVLIHQNYDNKNTLNHQRFHEEALTYAKLREIDLPILREVGLPVLIESNANKVNDKNYELYIVTEFINGSTLLKWRAERSTVSMEIAMSITLTLLKTLKICHAHNCFHRDIKPNNIILENDDPLKPVLIDFGQNYLEDPSREDITKPSEELGNRFLHLPELYAQSQDKRTSTTDLTFMAGILFFLLSGEWPIQLLDGEGKMPHQRDLPKFQLDKIAGQRYQRLASFFDKAFANETADRFKQVEEMVTGIGWVMSDKDEPKDGNGIDGILEKFDTTEHKRQIQAKDGLKRAIKEAEKILREIERELSGIVYMNQRQNPGSSPVRQKAVWRWFKQFPQKWIVETVIEVSLVGDEVKVEVSGETVDRISLKKPDYGQDFRDKVKKKVGQELNFMLTNPKAPPPEIYNFDPLKPFTSLEETLEDSRKRKRKIFAFVYDPNLPGRGKLDFILRNFLKNEKTKSTIDSAFTLALLPQQEFYGKSPEISGWFLKKAVWILLEADLSILKHSYRMPNSTSSEL